MMVGGGGRGEDRSRGSMCALTVSVSLICAATGSLEITVTPFAYPSLFRTRN